MDDVRVLSLQSCLQSWKQQQLQKPTRHIELGNLSQHNPNAPCASVCLVASSTSLNPVPLWRQLTLITSMLSSPLLSACLNARLQTPSCPVRDVIIAPCHLSSITQHISVMKAVL